MQTQVVKLTCRNISSIYSDIGRNQIIINTYDANGCGISAKVDLNWGNESTKTIQTDSTGHWMNIYEIRKPNSILQKQKLSVHLTGLQTIAVNNKRTLTLYGSQSGKSKSRKFNFQEINISKTPNSSADHFQQGFSGQKPMSNNYWAKWLFFSFWNLLLGITIEPVLTGTFFTPVLAGLSIIFLGLYGPGPAERRQMNLGYFLGWFWNTNYNKWRSSFIAFVFSLALLISWGGFGIPQQKTVINNPNPQTVEQQAEWNLRHHGFKGSDEEMLQQLGIKSQRKKEIPKIKTYRDRSMLLDLFFIFLFLLIFTVLYSIPVAKTLIISSDNKREIIILITPSATYKNINTNEITINQKPNPHSFLIDAIEAKSLIEIIKYLLLKIRK